MIRTSLDQEAIYESPDPLIVENESGKGKSDLLVATAEEDGALMNAPIDVFKAQEYFGNVGAQNYCQSVFSVAVADERKVESPFQRLQRLKGELAELESQLEQMSSDGRPSVWSLLQSEAQGLLRRAGNLERHPVWQAEAGQRDSLAELSRRLDEETAGTEQSAELRPASSSSFGLLERRASRLEALLGLRSVTISPESDPLPLLSTLQRLEKKVCLLDSQALEGVRAKANLLKWELEALSKTKAPSGGENSTAKLLEAMRKIEELSSASSQIQGLSAHLPGLLLRLKTLEGVHCASASAASSLSLLGQQLSDALVKQHENEQLAVELKEGLRRNLKAMQENVREVERRLGPS